MVCYAKIAQLETSPKKEIFFQESQWRLSGALPSFARGCGGRREGRRSGQSPDSARRIQRWGCGWVLDDEKFKNFYGMTVHHWSRLTMETPAGARRALVDDQLRGLSEVASCPPFGPFKDKKVRDGYLRRAR